MLEVPLELRCNVCGHDRFTLPAADAMDQDVRCSECLAFKCHADDLEQHMLAAASSLPPQPGKTPRRLNAV